MLDGDQVEQPQHLSLVEGPLDEPGRLAVAEVDDRAGDRGAGDGVHGGDVRGSEGGAGVDSDVLTWSPGSARNRDVRQLPVIGEQAMMRGGRAVRESGSGAARQYSRHTPPR